MLSKSKPKNGDTTQRRGLGELLRALLEQTDGPIDAWYKEQGWNYRPRFTPIMRQLTFGPATISELTNALAVSQGAVSQTAKLMSKAGLVEFSRGKDGRQNILKLSRRGRSQLKKLEPHWDATFHAIDELEREVGLPITKGLEKVLVAFDQSSFSNRIQTSAKTVKKSNYSKISKARNSHFLSGGDRYAQFRPGYPEHLAEILSGLCSEQLVALDVGCGSGQFTLLLSQYFEHVIGTDISAAQLAHAAPGKNITYLEQTAERFSQGDNSVDLVVAAQAAHWFDLDAFYAEVDRCLKPGGVLALISYGVPYIEGTANTIFQRLYWQDLHRYWPAERRYVENNYRQLPFPFEVLELPEIDCEAKLTAEQFIGYMTTWSSFRAAVEAGEEYVFEQAFEELESAWPKSNALRVRWPITIKATRWS